MCDEDWTSRDAEVRLAEPAERRAGLGLQHVPDYTTGYRFLRRLDEAVLEQLLSAVIQRLVPQPDRQAPVAMDATGLASGAGSTLFVKRAKDRGEGFTWRHWLQWTMAVDVDRRLMVAQTPRRGPYDAGATLRPLVDAAHQRDPTGLVLADAEFDREGTHQQIRQSPQGPECYSSQAGQCAVAHAGGQGPDASGRSRAPGRSLVTLCLLALLLGSAYHIYRLWLFV
jgi:hypothetical protein